MSASSASMKISFITTVYNEESAINVLLNSLFAQSKVPDEIIIVDGGSSDRTVAKIKNEKLKAKNYNGKFEVIVKKGNRALGRNEAIKQSSGDIIVCSDAGCILDKDWVKNIIKPFDDPKVDIVAGYYEGKAKTSFEKCIIPYFLIMKDRVNENSFLPATRSIAFKKLTWERVGEFDEQYSYNEDYVFAKKLKKIKAKIVFRKDAIAYWLPKKNLREAIASFFNFAFGDAQAKIFRPKVGLLFLRYFLVLILLVIFFTTNSTFFLKVLIGLIVCYILWAIIKNFKYVRLLAALYYLPLIQISSDLAIMLGTVKGLSTRNTNAK